MSADKRSLDELDALFRAVPAQATSGSRPAKKLRPGGAKASPPPLRANNSRTKREEKDSTRSRSIAVVNEPQQERITYARLPAALLPKGFRGAPSTPRGAGNAQSSARGGSRTTMSAVGAAAASRLTEFLRGVMMSGPAGGDRAAAAALESKLERKTMHLETVVSGKTEAQSAGERAGRTAGSARKHGLSGRQCRKKGLNALKARDGGGLSFRNLLGLHGLWKDYAARLVSQYGSNHKQLQQRILSADLQGCYLTVSRSSIPSMVNVAGILLRETPNTFQLVTPEGKTKTVLKRSCAVRLAFGGRVVNLDGRALEGRQPGRERGSTGAGGADDAEALPLPTAAL